MMMIKCIGRRVWLLPTVVVSSLATASVFAGNLHAPPVPASASKRMLHGQVSGNEIIDQLESVGIKCIITEGAKNKIVIDKVRLGSAAAYKGVSAGDVVTNVASAPGGINIDFSRADKNYRVFLRQQLLAPPRFKTDEDADDYLRSLEKDITQTQDKRAKVLEDAKPEKVAERLKKAMKNESSAKVGEQAVKASEILASKGNAIKQGDCPNCWFESALAALAETPDGHKRIAEMIKKTGERTYKVSFPEQAFPGDSRYVDVTIDELKDYEVRDTALWARILDCACMKKFPANQGIENDSGLKVLTGMPTHTLNPRGSSAANIAETIQHILTNKEPSIIGTAHECHLVNLPANHAYTLVAFDKDSGTVTIRNPWGGDAPIDTRKDDFVHAEPVKDGSGVRVLSDGYIQLSLEAISTNFNGIVWAGVK